MKFISIHPFNHKKDVNYYHTKYVDRFTSRNAETGITNGCCNVVFSQPVVNLRKWLYAVWVKEDITIIFVHSAIAKVYRNIEIKSSLI